MNPRRRVSPRIRPLAWSLASVACVAFAAPAHAQQGAGHTNAGDPAEVAVCDDLVVTHRPRGSTGSTDAVAITSQALERGSEGWAMVGWTAAAGTSIREVQVVDAGVVTSQPGTAEGVAGPASELRFCGTLATDTDATAPAATRSATPSGTGGTTTLSLLGATIGLLVGAVVLLMSRGARRSGGATP